MTPCLRYALPLLLGAATLHSAAAGASSPITARHGAATPPTTAEAALRATLPNGLRVVIVRNRLAPVVTTEINYLAGSVDAPPGFPGTAHALEHMMFRGSKGLDRDQLADLGARLGGGYNADTTETVTQYFYTAPAEDLGVALRVEALRMEGLSINQADWDKERGAIEQEVSRDLSSPAYKYFSQLQSILFAGTAYDHDALGTRPSFDKTDAKLLRGFYERWYAPNNAILVIVGDVDPGAALAQVTSIFGPLPRKDLPAHPALDLKPLQASAPLTFPTDYPVGFATLAYRMPGQKSADFAAADVLGDVIGSRRAALYGLVPQGKALLAQYAYQGKADAGMGIVLAAFPKGGDPQPLLAEMRGIIANIKKNGVSPELVAASKRQELAQLAFSADSISGLAELWSRVLAFQNLDSPDALAHAYAAVTPEDVNRVAREYLDPDHAVTAILEPRDSGHPIAAAGFGGAESFASTPDKPVTLPDWAADALRRLVPPGTPVQPTDLRLRNGLRLIVQPEHVSHTVTVLGRVRQEPDMQQPAGKEGVASIVDALFEYGSSAHDRIALQKAIDDIAAKEWAGPNFGLKVLTPHLEDGLALLAENELDPAMPAGAFKVVRQQVAAEAAGQMQAPSHLFARAVGQAILPPNDPNLREVTPQSAASVTIEDARAYYKAAYRPDLTTIVVIGDVTPERARAAVEKSFGGWTATGPAPAIDLPAVPRNAASQAHVPDDSAVQDSVVLAQSLALNARDPDHFMLSLGNEILAGGFSSRLYRDLRVKSGYVYTVSSRFNWDRTRTRYTISYGADPENVGKARGLALRDLEAMRSAPVSADELALAKASLLRRLPMGLSSIDAIAAEDLFLAERDLPLDQPWIAARHYYDASPRAVQDAFRKWIAPAGMAEVVKGPPVKG